MTNTMWGGRFTASPSEIMEEINASIDFDKRLWRHDILASKAHVAMLGATGIVTAKEAKEIARGLDQIMAEIEAGKFKFSRALEDIHLNVESRLRELIGPVAGKLHTARSRNDQVATDFRLYVRDEIGAIDGCASRASARARQEGASICRRGDAGLYPSPDRPAHHFRPSPPRLCRDAGAGPGPLRRRRQAARGVPFGRGRPRRHLLPHRPGGDGAGAWLRAGRRPTRSMRFRTATSRSRPWPRPRSPQCICRGWPRRS